MRSNIHGIEVGKGPLWSAYLKFMNSYRDICMSFFKVQKDLETAYLLAKSFEEAKETEASKLFLAMQKSGLFLVKKKSFRGAQLVAMHYLRALARKKRGSALNFDINISEVASVVQSVRASTQKMRDETAKKIGISPEQFEKTLQFLETQKTAIKTKRKIKKPTSHPLPKLLPLGKKEKAKVISATPLEKNPENLKAKGFDEAFVQDLSKFIESIATDKEEVIATIADVEKSPEEMKTRLAQLIWGEIVLGRSDDEIDLCRKLLERVEHQKAEKSIFKDKPLKQMALVFGDHFIEGASVEVLGKIEGGASSRDYAQLIASFMEQKAALFARSPIVAKVKTMLAEGIDLRSTQENELLTNVKRRLATKGVHSCLLFGGWATHEIVYEIERQENGKYTLRVYNKGGGLEYFRQYIPEYRVKQAPCFAIKDINEKALLSASTLGCLKSLCNKEKEEGMMPQDILSGHLLPMLGGIAEPLPHDVQQAVSPQQSGTCTYMCLTGFLARAMPAQDYKLFKAEFKIFLLEKYKNELEAISQKDITKEADYRLAIFTHDLLKNAIEQFSKSVAKLEQTQTISRDRVDEAKKQAAIYHTLLNNLQKKIAAFERGGVEKSVIKASTPLKVPLLRDTSPLGKEESAVSTLMEVHSSLLSPANRNSFK